MAVRKTGTRRTGTYQRKSTRKTASQGKQKRVPVSIVFWIVLFIGLIAVFFALLPTVRNADFLQNQTTRVLPPSQETLEQEPAAGQNTVPETPPATSPTERPPTTTVTERPPAETTPERPPATTERPPTIPPVETPPQTTTTPGSQPSATQPAETRDRSVYFMQETSGSSELLPIKVNRKLAVSDSPLLDSLNALLVGPTSAEKNRGLINCIPSGSRVIRVEMRGNTAYINFNEQFQYNTGGREDYAAQIKQIVWTATEFSNVHDVQILIDGNRVDFIGEGIMIGSPLKR